MTGSRGACPRVLGTVNDCVDGASPDNPASTFPYGRTAYRAANVKGPRPSVVQVFRR